MRIVAGVVLRSSRNHRAVDQRANGGVGHARHHAAQIGAVRMERQSEFGVDVIEPGRRVDDRRNHVAGQTLLRVSIGRQEVELTALLADQHVRAGRVAAAREVEADERDLAGALVADAAERFQLR